MKNIIFVFFMLFITSSSFATAYQDKADKLYQQGKYELALIFFEKAFLENPTNPEINFYLGNIYNNKREFNKAIIAFKRGLENVHSTPTKAKFLYNIARSLQAIQNYKQALVYYDKLQAILSVYKNQNPNNNDLKQLYKDVWLHKGMIFYNMQNKQLTIRAWENYLLYVAQSPEYYSVLKAIETLKSKDFKWKAKEVVLREEDKKIVEDIIEPKDTPLPENETKEAEDKLISELRNREVDEAGETIERTIDSEASKVRLTGEDDITLSDKLDIKESDYEEIER